MTNIKFISKSNKKSSKKELKEHDPSDPSSTSQIPGYKNEPELVGEDGKLKPMGVKEGDKVLFGKWSGTEVKLDGNDLLIMKESDIMGIVQ